MTVLVDCFALMLWAKPVFPTYFHSAAARRGLYTLLKSE